MENRWLQRVRVLVFGKLENGEWGTVMAHHPERGWDFIIGDRRPSETGHDVAVRTLRQHGLIGRWDRGEHVKLLCSELDPEMGGDIETYMLVKARELPARQGLRVQECREFGRLKPLPRESVLHFWRDHGYGAYHNLKHPHELAA